MAQLSDDCFAYGGPMMSVDEAVATIAARVSAVRDVETVHLIQADGRVLASSIAAPMPLPPFTNSAVDGYAVSSGDLPVMAERSFSITGRIAAGDTAPGPIASGQAIRIFTGAPLPHGADTVFMQEDVRIDHSGSVILPPGLKPGANVRPAGEDVAVGHDALPAGRHLRPQDVALVAALGMAHVEVRRRIRVAVFSTGNEVVPPGGPRGVAQLFDSNRYMLMSMLVRLGCEVSDLGILPDDHALLAAGLKKAAASHDLILTSGGVSTGEEDHVRASVESVGSLILWRMAIKPGRPVAMGIIDGTPFVGLPGNPVASFVTFAYIVRPIVLALAGTEVPSRPIPILLRAAFDYRKKSGRREYVRVNLRTAEDGSLELVKFPREGAGLLSSLVQTDGLVELSEETTYVSRGQMVGFLAYASLIL
jgi:molybdopterin molybdotransferase